MTGKPKASMTMNINGTNVTLDDVKRKAINSVGVFKAGIGPVLNNTLNAFIATPPTKAPAAPTPSPASTATPPAPSAPVAPIVPKNAAPIGIDIPANFQVSSHSKGSKKTKGKYVHLIAQKYDTADDEHVVNDQFREFVAMRKMAAGILPMCPTTGEFLLIRQFRYPAYANGFPAAPHSFAGNPEENGWLYEIIAGVIEPSETPEQTVIKEAKEEGGIDIDPTDMKKVHHCFMTPGITNEEMHVFTALVSSTTTGTATTGLASEQELIRAKWMKADEIRELHARGLIRDAKTIIALYAARVL